MSGFCGEELRNALTEEAAAIHSFQMTTAEQLRATASVTLLEGRTVSVCLTMSGYSIVDEDGPVFESIEQLLRSASKMYERQRQEALMAALANLSA
ncbi:hypothetical protein HMN09_00961500 [Mycena chlorophos]|uniref:GSKIP domain-containing protein n=1 Tax=Mycena chlorophos TaxID=658473 RepID=A0A8H6SH99_MYCCL|nr:hypothetical protein HMN09_00961500 [Mycena chlorophos]